ncbi:putative transcriptional regulator [Desulfosporosinus acidiphilus SJ4]|uniref:Putative transcriptional regulator n=1 Tax=Desulfosporosinus acidiphilus (strain DSM 22704 / JCM 16185 / SJ4) TaxID=646529 RepID=I4D1F7_DESAJ|nr:metalloregulator ArsR/SmtB family transcription factor [Desulfosporosinus acidiphilus]AFM39631.1 putative transcriptional regulator [Desulfosporosinus acidiphilus SJ4]
MELLETLKILADDTRFKIIQLLISNDFCVGALARTLGISEAAVSQHIQVLRRGGFLRGEKRGYWTHYVVEKNILIQMADELKVLSIPPVNKQFICLRESMNKDNNLGGRNMCKCKCEHPEKLQGKPGDCSKKQIQECHGDENHSCDSEKKEK